MRQAQAKTEGGADAIRPFRVHFPDEALSDLKRRIAAARWPTKELVEDRSQGVQLATLREAAKLPSGRAMDRGGTHHPRRRS